jgi:hypothetical protein
MRIDMYTKTILTVIALSLVWIGLGGPSLLPSVQAQANVQNVRIVGWEKSATTVQDVRIVGWGNSPGAYRTLPLPVVPKPD